MGEERGQAPDGNAEPRHRAHMDPGLRRDPPPYNTYGAEEVSGQIQALLENGLDGGIMAWNAMCSIPKLETLKPAFDALP